MLLAGQGHTSSDPSVGISGDVTAQLLSAVAGNNPQGYAIHVKGKSGLKQTKVVLDCWAQHPEFPTLVVVGKASKEELSPSARAAQNIIYYPPLPREDGKLEAGSVELLIEPDRLRALQTAAGIHLCPSVREGFGHYLNEARAVGALVVTVDHPPMNELVSRDSGLLVPTVFTMSEKVRGGLRARWGGWKQSGLVEVD
jgi:glycosyltransferase involved in cell wall biosynthesis